LLSPQEQQYLATTGALLQSKKFTFFVILTYRIDNLFDIEGQNPSLSLLSFPYGFGSVPWGMYPQAAAQAGLIQQVSTDFFLSMGLFTHPGIFFIVEWPTSST